MRLVIARCSIDYVGRLTAHLAPALRPLSSTRTARCSCTPTAAQTNGQIVRRLAITEGTVRVHLQNIYERLQVSSRTAAVTRAFPDRAAV